jgi:hypothetical protein
MRATIALLLAAVLPGQVVQFANHSDKQFGPAWFEATVDRLPRVAAGLVGDVPFIVGRQVGIDTWVVDLRVTLKPGERRTVDLGLAVGTAQTSADVEVPGLPADSLAHCGGPLRVNGIEPQWISLAQDGAGWLCHLRARHGRMLHTDLWLKWYGDQPSWCRGWSATTASNPAVPDLAETAAGGVILTWGDAIVQPTGGTPFFLVPPGTEFCDGQARLVPFVAAWPRHLPPASTIDAFPAVGAVGVQTLHPGGNARHPADLDLAAILRSAPDAARLLHTWEPALRGPSNNAKVTGAQEDQLWHSEPLLRGGVGIERVLELDSYKRGGFPYHHLEVTGEQFASALHPRCWFGESGRPNYATAANRLGKPLAFDFAAVPGPWFGPDYEHPLCGRLFESSRLTGSPLLQWELEALARAMMQQWTVDPAYVGAYWCFASRAFGMEGLMASRLWRALGNRALAERVRVHWRARWAGPLQRDDRGAPALVGRKYWHDGFKEQGRWAGWQQAQGALGLDEAGRDLGVPEARAIALEGALVVVDECFYQVAGQWRSYKTLPLGAGLPDLDNTFWLFGYPCAVAVVLRHQPTHQRARSIWQQMQADATSSASCSWLAPGVR